MNRKEIYQGLLDGKQFQTLHSYVWLDTPQYKICYLISGTPDEYDYIRTKPEVVVKYSGILMNAFGLNNTSMYNSIDNVKRAFKNGPVFISFVQYTFTDGHLTDVSIIPKEQV